jgi:hypothetical protein
LPHRRPGPGRPAARHLAGRGATAVMTGHRPGSRGWGSGRRCGRTCG